MLSLDYFCLFFFFLHALTSLSFWIVACQSEEMEFLVVQRLSNSFSTEYGFDHVLLPTASHSVQLLAWPKCCPWGDQCGGVRTWQASHCTQEGDDLYWYWQQDGESGLHTELFTIYILFSFWTFRLGAYSRCVLTVFKTRCLLNFHNIQPHIFQ